MHKRSCSTLKLLDVCDLFARVQTLWTGTGTVQDCMATVKLELVVNSLKSFLCVLIPTVAYPPA